MSIRLFFILFVFLGCSVKQPSLDSINNNVNELERLIIGLSPKVSRSEALNLSRNAIDYSLYLSKQYKAISSPWIQNTLVNMGIKKRGLCHEWAEDLFKYLLHKKYKTLKLYAIGANIGDLNEHNALAVSFVENDLNKSIILDAWRHAGNLYFKKIRKDKAYKWKERKGLYEGLPPTGGK